MIREEAEKILDQLETKSDLSKEDIVRGFQISLGLGRHIKALEYQEKYCELVYTPEENRYRLLRAVREIGASSSSIDIAQKALEYVKDDKKELKYHLYCNIAWLQREYALDTSLEKLSELKDQRTRYKIAKDVFRNNPLKAFKIVNGLSEKYKLAFPFFVHSYQIFDDDIDKEIDNLLDMLEENEAHDDLMLGYILLEIAFSIVRYRPYKAYSILDKLHDNYIEGIELKIEVLKSIAPLSLDKAIEHIRNIDDPFKAEAITHLIDVYHDRESLLTIFKSLDSLIGEPSDCYIVLYQLKKKIMIPFESLYENSCKFKPEEVIFEQEVLETYYFRYRDKSV